MKSTRYCVFIIALVAVLHLWPRYAFSQAEHVEIIHPVYEFLNRMHVRGAVTGYSRSSLPLERKQITRFLRDLQSTTLPLSSTERGILARYVEEFVDEADGNQRTVSIFGTAMKDIPKTVFSDNITHLYRWRSEDGESTMYMDFLASLEYRALLTDEGNTNLSLGQIGGRFRGTLSGLLGYSLRATNGTAQGNRSLAMKDQQLRRNFTYGTLDKDFFDLAEAAVSISWDWGSASLGKEKRLWGTGRSNLALISTNAEPFDALQLHARFGAVRFSFLHGSVLSEMELLEGFRPYYDAKYVAMHRAEVDLFNTVRFGVFEAVVYSSREIDASYLNPINFYKSAEHAGGDRDNPMLGFELSSLGIPDLELYGTWLIDDVDFARLGDAWWGNKFLWQAGAITTLIANTELILEYSRIDPYVYSHRLRGNQYTHDGASLGFELAPNSDELYIGASHWLTPTLILGLHGHFRRHGRNEMDSEGNILVNHGGDIYESLDYERDSEIAPFLAGVRDDSTMLSFTLRYELGRNIFLHGKYWYRTRSSDAETNPGKHYLSLLLDIQL